MTAAPLGAHLLLGVGLCVCVGKSRRAERSTYVVFSQEKTAEHSAQSMSWEEGRQEDMQPGDLWPPPPWEALFSPGARNSLTGPRGGVLAGF